jgi:hypothetical protein
MADDFLALVHRLREGGEGAQEAAESLGTLGDPRAIQPLLATLSATEDRWLRNRVALALMDLKAHEAVPALLDAAHRQLDGDHGTLIYALEALDCRKHLEEIAFFLCHGDYEAQCAASTILEELDGSIDPVEREKACNLIHAYLKKNPGMASDRKEFIQDVLKCLMP